MMYRSFICDRQTFANNFGISFLGLWHLFGIPSCLLSALSFDGFHSQWSLLMQQLWFCSQDQNRFCHFPISILKLQYAISKIASKCRCVSEVWVWIPCWSSPLGVLTHLYLEQYGHSISEDNIQGPFQYKMPSHKDLIPEIRWCQDHPMAGRKHNWNDISEFPFLFNVDMSIYNLHQFR